MVETQGIWVTEESQNFPGYAAPGSTPDNPFIITAFLLNRSVGHFCLDMVFAASVKRLFKHAKLYCYFRQDRPYKAPMVSMCKYVDLRISEPSEGVGLLVDYFDGTWQAPFSYPNPAWEKLGISKSHLMLTPNNSPMQWISSFPNIGYMSVIGDQATALGAQITALGLDPNRWFMAIHCRESSYEYRRYQTPRDGNHESFLQLIDFVIERLGGQVVRVGHFGSTPYPERADFIDLTTLEDGFPIQAFALNRARFMVGSASGMTPLSCCFGTPTCYIDQTSLGAAFYNRDDIVLTQHLVDNIGRRLSQAEALEKYFLDDDSTESRLPEGFKLIKTTGADLKQAAQILYERTMDCQGWRLPKDDEPIDPPGFYSTPPKSIKPVPLMEFPELFTAG